jgi:signal peptidase II
VRRRSNKAIAFCLLGTIGLVALDLGTKNWAEATLSVERVGERPRVCAAEEGGFLRYQRVPRRPGIVLIEDVLELEYAENCGAAFGLLRDAPTEIRTTVFGIAAIAATLVLLSLFVQGRGGPFFAWCVPLVVAGALGNLVDRIRYGYVIDFIHFHWRDAFDYPTFNVADIAITVGVALLLIDGFRREGVTEIAQEREPSQKRTAGPGEDADPGEANRGRERRRDPGAAGEAGRAPLPEEESERPTP